MKYFRMFFAIFTVFTLFSCGKAPDIAQLLTHRIKSQITAWTGTGAPAENPAPTLHIDQTDGELRLIAQNARDTLPVFFRHLLRPAKDETNFCIKYPFRTDEGSGFSMEQLWLTNISFKDGVYYGVLTNNPFYIASMKKGDTVSFSADEITDWMYIKNGKITGGLSIKYLLEQIHEHERTGEQRAMLKMFLSTTPP